MEHRIGEHLLRLVQGDITEQEVDGLVNPANERLQLGGGVAGAIRRKGGPAIQEECDRIGGTRVGSSVITGAGDLPAQWVLHTVGPRMGDGNEEKKLRQAVDSALRLAAERGLESIALPAISTGIFGVPLETCARVSMDAAFLHCRRPGPPHDIRFVLYDENALRQFEEALRRRAAAEPPARP